MRRIDQRAEPEFLLDTARLNAKYAENSDNPYRLWTGTTEVPYDADPVWLKRILYDAAGRYIDAMKKRGWELMDKIRIGSPRIARDESGLPDLSRIEYRLRGTFKFQGPPRTTVLELDPATVKQAPDHLITLAQARQAWGIA